jgi:outer membrane immunogenic protein
MNRMLFAAAIALAASPALAADLPQAMPPPPPQAPATYVPTVAPQYNWGGIYIGLNGGYGFGKSSWGIPENTGNFNINGGVAGGTIGANFQTGQVVFGIEADGDWADITGTGNSTAAGDCVTPAASCGTSSDWLATIRGRIGYAFDRVLVYGTAGGAGGDVKATLTVPGLTTSTNNSEFGWTAGAGVEVALTDNITAKVEYLYLDLQNGSFGCTPALCTTTLFNGSVPASFETSLVRVGVNFKFNPF